MSTSRGDYLKKLYFSEGIAMIFMILGVEVGNKNKAKIDQKMESKMECLLASIFDRFWWTFGGKLGRTIG